MTSRIGVFVCDCRGQVSDRLDADRVVRTAMKLDRVVFAKRADLLCDDKALTAAVSMLKEEGCDRFLFAGCSPRSSLKFPEERLASAMQQGGIASPLLEVANVREQCTWQHEDPEAATRKALDLLRMAHARLLLCEPTMPHVAISSKALVIGGGAAGLQTAKDLRAAGVEVTLAERGSWLGGRLCQANRLFQCEGWPSVCDSVCVGPVQAKDVILDQGITALTHTEVVSAERRNGSFRVALRSAPRFVNAERCICCGDCAAACPEETVRAFDEGLTKRKAIDKEFERALPDTFTITEAACTKCGDCVPACPTEAIDLDATPRTITEDFGAVFIATGFDPIDLSGYPQYLRSHPNVVTAIELERILDQGLKRPSDGDVAERVVFVQCAGSRAGPDKTTGGVSYCSKTCCSVTAKQVDRVLATNPAAEATVVYYRDLRTYERALEALSQNLQNIGVAFVEGDLTAVEGGEEGALTVRVEPTERADSEDNDEPEPVSLEADLVVLAAAQRPSRGALELCRMFSVPLDRHGYPIEIQPRIFRPTESYVDRVFVVGASCGPKVVQQATEQASAAAMRALPALLRGRVIPSRYASHLSDERCTRCRTCEAVCPHGAIVVTAERAHSDPAFCQGCGLCSAACPVHAAELRNFNDQQLLRQARVAFTEAKEGEPRLLALLCYWCSYSAADFAGIHRMELVPNYRAIRVRCSSSVNTGLLMQLLRMGVDGILVAGCPERSCHHLWGNFLADKRIELARMLMRQLGLQQGRLRFEYIGAPMAAKLRETLAAMDKTLRTLGPNPVAAQSNML